MPVLRWIDTDGKLETHILKMPGRKGMNGGMVPEGKATSPPVVCTMGNAPASPNHIDLPDCLSAQDRARIVFSSAANFAFILTGGKIDVNGRPLSTLRVLRHGDVLKIATTEMTYLDFAPYKVSPEQVFKDNKCPGCKKADERDRSPGSSADAETNTVKDEHVESPRASIRKEVKVEQIEVVDCPWCGESYHLGCWLTLEKCTKCKGTAYPVRRMLLSELEEYVRLEEIPEKEAQMNPSCPGCRELIESGDKILRCPECRSAFHAECLLSVRKKCIECSFDIPGLMNDVVYRMGGNGEE